MKKQWWKEAVAYEIYPRSFNDSDGDGIGDIQGIIEKLDYLKDFGIDVIWICPMYQSPNDDNGYDISDYQAIMNDYGTMQDFDQLLEETHRRGMKLIMDLVINHTSDEHQWFIESRSSKENPYRDFYIWHPGNADGSEPNNWASIFGGSAWEYDEQTEEYYLHVFSKKQPDLNWENQAVREELYKMVNWWLDKGIDGFRVDAISHIKKIEGFPDLPNPSNLSYVPSFDGHRNREGIDLFLSEFVEKTINRYDVMTVGEANGVTMDEAEEWVGEDNGYFDMIFQFEHVDLWGEKKEDGLNLSRLKRTLSKWQNGLEGRGWNALFIENHDLPRVVSAWGDTECFRKESATALGTMYFFMQGTPFIYQGQEIGMTNVQFDSIEEYRDVAIKNYYTEQLAGGHSAEEAMAYIWKNGRDNTRTPMQWTNEQNAGFSTGEPWIGVNENYKEINVEKELSEKDSIYQYYKRMIQLRKEHPTLIYGDYQIVQGEHESIYAYIRTDKANQLLIVVNLTSHSTSIEFEESLHLKKLLMSNREVKQPLERKMNFNPYEARIYKIESEPK